MSPPRRARITAQDFYDFDKCPHRVHLNRFGDPAEKLPESEFLNLLFENGTTHEWEVVKDLIYETPAGKSQEERAASTLDLMKRGAKFIYQGVLLQPTEISIPDLLEGRLGDQNLEGISTTRKTSSLAYLGSCFTTSVKYLDYRVILLDKIS